MSDDISPKDYERQPCKLCSLTICTCKFERNYYEKLAEYYKKELEKLKQNK